MLWWRLRQLRKENNPHAAEALVKIGPRAVPALITMLSQDSGSSGVKETMIVTLGKIGDARAIEPLVRILEKEGLEKYTSYVAKIVVAALTQIGPPAVPHFITALTGSKHDLRRLAAEALARLHWKPETSSQRISLAIALHNSEVLVEEGTAAIEPLLTFVAARKDADWSWAASTLAQLGSVAVEPLIAALADKNRMAAETAAVALGKIGDLRAARPLLAAWEAGNYFAGDALGQIHASDILLSVAQNHDNSEMRRRAICILSEIKSPDPLALFITLFTAGLINENPEVRKAALQQLSYVRKQDQTIDLLKTALKDENWEVRKAAAEILGCMGDKPAVELLIAALHDNSQQVRLATRRSSEEIQVKEIQVIEPLKTALKDENWEVREVAAQMLGRTGQRPAVDLLVAALHDEDRRVRLAALRALKEIGSYSKADFHADPTRATRRGSRKKRGPKVLRKLEQEGFRTALSRKRIVEPLLVALESAKQTPHENTCESIIAEINEIIKKMGADALEELTTALKNHQSCFIRCYAAEFLGFLDQMWGGDNRPMQELIAALRDKEPKVRAQAAWSLDTTWHWKPEDDEQRVTFRAALCFFKEIEAKMRQALIAALRDKEPLVRAQAARSLDTAWYRKLENDEQRIMLGIALCCFKDGKDRATAASYLLEDLQRETDVLRQWSKSPKAFEENRCWGDACRHDAESRRFAARVLGDLRDVRAVEPLIMALNYECDKGRRGFRNKTVAMVAVEALAKIGDMRAIEPLFEVLKNTKRSFYLRSVAAAALGGFHYAPAVRPLVELFNEAQKEKEDWDKGPVAKVVVDALESILGKNIKNVDTDGLTAILDLPDEFIYHREGDLHDSGYHSDAKVSAQSTKIKQLARKELFSS